MNRRRRTAFDAVRLRRSLATAPSLPADRVAWLLGAHERMAVDRRRLLEIVLRLHGPAPHLRAALDELRRFDRS